MHLTIVKYHLGKVKCHFKIFLSHKIFFFFKFQMHAFRIYKSNTFSNACIPKSIKSNNKNTYIPNAVK